MAATDKNKLDVVTEDFIKWLDDESYFQNYDHYVFDGEAVLIRVYQYVPKNLTREAKRLVDLEGNSLVERMNHRIITYIKVIAVGDNTKKGFKPGDVSTIADVMTKSKMNVEYEHYQSLMNERPQPISKEVPERLISRFTEWERHIFVDDKLKVTLDESDAFTFLIPETYLKGRVIKDRLIEKLTKSLGK